MPGKCHAEHIRKWIEDGVAIGRAAERIATLEECIPLVCSGCKMGIERGRIGHVYYGEDRMCMAWQLHKLLAEAKEAAR